MMENNAFVLKRKLETLREGEIFSITVKELANFYAGGEMKLHPGRENSASPFLTLSKKEKMSHMQKAYRDLILFLRNPPDNIHAEEKSGSFFGVSFLKLENGGLD